MKMLYGIFIKLDTPVPGSATDKLIRLLRHYTHHPKDKDLQVIEFSPQKWYTDRELLVLFKKVRGQIEHSMDADRKRIKTMRGPSGRGISIEDQEEYLNEAKNDRLDDLQEFKELIPAVVADFKKRLNTALEKKEPADQERLKNAPEFAWVQDPSTFIKRVQDTLLLDEEMEKIREFKLLGTDFELEKRETARPEDKQSGGEMVPFAKYREIEEELKLSKYEIKKVAEKFKDMPIPEAEGTGPGGKASGSEVMAAENYRYLSDEKRKTLIDKYLKYKGGDLPGFGAPSEIEWAVSDAELHRELEKVKADRDSLDHKRREPVDDREKNRLEILYNEKIEELRLLQNLEENRNHRVNMIERAKKEWNKSEAEAVLMESEEKLKKLEAHFAEKKKEYDDWMATLIKKADEDEKEGLESIKRRTDINISENIRPTNSEKFIQNVFANVLVSNLEWFKKLHSLYRGASWSQSKSRYRVPEKNIADHKKEFLTVRKADDAEPVSLASEYRNVSDLRNKAYANLKRFANNDIYSLKSPYDDAESAIQSLKEFSDACKSYLKNLEKAGQKVETFQENAGVGRYPGSGKWKQPISSLLRKISETIEAQEFDRVFPREQTLAKLRGIEHYDWAEEELQAIYDFFKREYVHPSPKLKSNAEEMGETFEDFLRKYINAVLNVFVDTWTKVEESKENSSEWVKRRYPILYEEILNLQKSGVFPELSMSKIKPIEKGIASRKSVIDYIEKNWLNSTPESFKQGLKKWEHIFENPALEEGGGGSANKGRTNHSKEPKPIVYGTQEQIDRELVDFLQTDKTPEAFVKELLFSIGKSLRREVDADKIIDMGTVASSLIKILTDIPKMMKNLWIQVPGVSDRSVRAETSLEVEKMRKHAPQFAPGAKPEKEDNPIQYKTLLDPGPWRHRRNRPDIILTGKPEDQLKQAMKIFEKIRRLYHVIEYLLGKSKSTVEEKIHDAGFPNGLLEGIDHLHRILGKGPHTPEVGERKEKAPDFN